MKRLLPGRPVVYCINWSHSDAPHAAVQVLGPDHVVRDAFFPTWEHAMDFALLYARSYRRSLEAVTG